MKRGGEIVMKYLVAMLVAALLLGAVASAEVVGVAGDDYIIRHIAPNGQELFFVAMEPEPFVIEEDVNFDGVPDLVVTTVRGASNFFCEFFIRVGDQYSMVEHPFMDYGFCNHTLYPEQGVVVSHTNDGYAGALHETHLYRWDGDSLVLLRRAVSDSLENWVFDGQTRTQTIDDAMIHMQIWDYSRNIYEGELIWEKIIALDDPAVSGELDGIFAEEEAALWEGLR